MGFTKSKSSVTEAMLVEYNVLQAKKKELETRLKELNNLIKDDLLKNSIEKIDVGEFRVSMVIPDKSKLDEDKALVYLKSKLSKDSMFTKKVLDEDKLTVLINDGKIDLTELKEEAWITDKGTPRLTVKKV